MGVDPANAIIFQDGIEQLRCMCFIFKDQRDIRGACYLGAIDP